MRKDAKKQKKCVYSERLKVGGWESGRGQGWNQGRKYTEQEAASWCRTVSPRFWAPRGCPLGCALHPSVLR